LFEESERSRVSAQSLLDNTEDLIVKEAAIALVTAQDPLGLLVGCEEYPHDLNNGQGRSESVAHDGIDKSLKQAIRNSYPSLGWKLVCSFAAALAFSTVLLLSLARDERADWYRIKSLGCP